MKKCVLLLLALVLLNATDSLLAQGTAFTYQGQLQNGGSPANGNYDFTFALFNNSSTNPPQLGAPLTDTNIGVTNGLFTVTLDFGSVFTGNPTWLSIAVRTNGGAGFTALSPLQELTPTPYAIYTASAGSVLAANIVGTVSAGQLPPSVLTNGETGVNITGTFSGNGAGVTNVNLLSVNTGGAILFTNYGKFIVSSSPRVGGGPVCVCAADVNGDGKVDLISANSFDNTLTVLTNNGSGGFVASQTYGVGNYPVSVCAADVNGDGKVDLICANESDNTLTVLTNNRSGGFVTSKTYGVGDYPDSVCAADVNGDGKVDLICVNEYDYTLTVLTNNGSGGFATSGTYGVGYNPDSVCAADVNGDGKVDLICANEYDNTLTVLTNNGSGGFVMSKTYGVGYNPDSVCATDVNGDGKVDLICANQFDNTLTVLTNNGSGGFATSGAYGTGGSPCSVCAADVNGDGKVDLISANEYDGTLSVLTNNGSGGFAFSSSPEVDNDPYFVCAADVNGDGKVDLICANQYDNTLTVLLNTPLSTATFIGNGANLTALNASQLTSGTIPLAQLPGSVVISGESGVTLSGSFSGNGSGLTSLNASQLTGGIPPTELPPMIAFLNANQTFTGQDTFSGNVGIGTASPIARLSVDVGNGGGFSFPAALFQVENCGAPCAQPAWTEAARLWNQNGYGRVGLGFLCGTTGNLTNMPTVYIGTGDYGSQSDLRIATGNGTALTDRLYINGSTGAVGIGTTTPAATLDVVGNIHASGTFSGPTSLTLGTSSSIAPLTVPPNVPGSAVGSVVTETGPCSVAVAGRYAYVVDLGFNLLQVFDVSIPSAPVGLGSVATGGGPRSVAVAGRYAYVASSGLNKLQIFDVSNPSALVSVGSVTTGNSPYSVAVAGRYAYVVNAGGSSLQVIDVSNPSAPAIAGSVATGSLPESLVVAGRYAYVGNAGDGTLQVFDVSNPSSPASVGLVNTGNDPQSVAVAGGYAYVANFSDSTLQVFNVSNPSGPISVGSVNTGSEPQSVAVAGRYAYVANFNANTLQVFDVSTPSTPVSVGSVATGGEAQSVAVSGRYAYVANLNASTLQVFDLGGAYIQQLEAGAMETGTLQTRDNLTVGNSLNVRGGLTVSGSARVSGGLSVDNGTITGNGGGLTGLNAANLSGALPAISGASLTSLPASANFTGSVGVGMSSATHALLDVGNNAGSYNLTTPNREFTSSSGTTLGSLSANSSASASIYAAGNIVTAGSFIATSDERVKTIEGRSDAGRDLATLLGITVTDFRYKDVIAHGAGPQKKVIAQQVEKVFPQAVSKHTDAVPDIYKPAACKDGWVALATDLKKGDRVKLISGKAEGVYEVLEVAQDRFRTDFKPAGDKVFVYGREVNDFRAVDYDAIAMLNVSATQELSRRIEAQAGELAARDATIAGLQQDLAGQKEQLARMQAEFSNMQKAVARLTRQSGTAVSLNKAAWEAK